MDHCESPEKDNQDDATSLFRGKAGIHVTLDPGEEKARGNLINIYISTWREFFKNTAARQFSEVLSDKVKSVQVTEHCTGCLERLWSLSFGDHLELFGHGPRQHALDF